MGSSEREFYTDPSKLAEGFLFAEFFLDASPPEGKVLSQEHIDKCCFTLKYWRGDFYRYDGMRYCRISVEDLKCRIIRYLHKFNEKEFSSERSQEYVRITSQKVNNIMLCLKGNPDVYLACGRRDGSWRLDGCKSSSTYSFTNGLAVIYARENICKMGERDPRFFSTGYFPYAYKPEAKCPGWLEFLDEVMEGDAERIKLLQQWAGYLVGKHKDNHQKFMLIAGEGQNGKTVFTTLMEKLVGEDNVTHIPISRFGDRFALTSTLGKVLNSSSEASHSLDEKAEMILKSYTSGDRMTFERKFKEPVSACPTAKVMISTNQLPAFCDKSQGIWRRMLFVPFEKNIPEQQQNPNLVSQLQTELSGIFNWAIEGLVELFRAGRFVQPARCRRAISQYRKDVNPARSFLQDNYTFSLEYDGLRCKEIYASYTTWCRENGYRPLNASNFGKEVKRAFKSVQKQQKRMGRKRVMMYFGLAVIEGSEVGSESIASCQHWQ